LQIHSDSHGTKVLVLLLVDASSGDAGTLPNKDI
jgi:hypothetical protein